MVFGRLASRIELRMLLLTLAVMLALAVGSPHFRTLNNLLNVMDQSVVVGMVALGQTLVILIGGIDLSVGSLVGVSGIVMGLGFPVLGLGGGILVGLLTGALAGAFNGVVTVFGRVAPFVVTLGMMSIARSLPTCSAARARSAAFRHVSPGCRTQPCSGCRSTSPC